MKIAFFDTKQYDKLSFEKFGKDINIHFKFFETKLNEDTVDLATGFDVVCTFVNDTVNKKVIDCMYKRGIKVLALRCAGFNNVDLKATKDLGITVLRVPSYSPAAVAEFAMASNTMENGTLSHTRTGLLTFLKMSSNLFLHRLKNLQNGNQQS